MSCQPVLLVIQGLPGCGDGLIAADVPQLKSILTSLLQNVYIVDVSIGDKHVIEFCRHGAAELHSVASYVGGVVSQEVIKILTHQYVPLYNTYIILAQCCQLHVAQ